MCIYSFVQKKYRKNKPETNKIRFLEAMGGKVVTLMGTGLTVEGMREDQGVPKCTYWIVFYF